jgi:prepilin-type N-terminal cleavage/methylation domain-containing protein/prepilin-type processing-associated H-X9-DG protein
MHDSKTQSRTRYGTPLAFTLVELLVVITIIGILIALLLPAVQAAREAARRMQCANNFKQAGLALHNYHSAKGCFPTGSMDMHRVSASAVKLWSWSAYLLPFVEYQTVHDMIDFSQPDYWTGAGNQSAAAKRIPAYVCPSDPQGVEGVWVSGATPLPQCGYTNMCGVADSVNAYVSAAGWPYWPRLFPEVDGVMGGVQPCAIADINDGTSNTLAIGEVTGKGPGTYVSFFWTADNLLSTKDGINGPYTATGGIYPSGGMGGMYQTGFASYHPGGCTFAMADGSASFISQNISRNILAALTTRNGPSSSNIANSPSQVVSPEPLISGPP